MAQELKEQLDEVLGPEGAKSANFFLAAGLYHARQISFSTAASLAGLSFEAFRYRLCEYFGKGFIVDEENVLEDLQTAEKFRQHQ
ncbi:MAG: hypothetical protein AB7F20_01320 [Geoalkalibacter sp.]|jgi:hypothetical protein|uniref:hypothetical protein n=1 Tax=Geoalkalibacter sp. TaxID=3041440 RepID=UPI002A987FFA|nr:UPF0175 family protein [Thermodesulfobacteriota bacterium]